nr:mucin-1-like [Aegilops tauschii subsp. strangulata]
MSKLRDLDRDLAPEVAGVGRGAALERRDGGGPTREDGAELIGGGVGRPPKGVLVRPSYNGRTRKGQPPHVPVFARPRTSPCLRTGSTSRAVRLAAAVPYASAPRFGPALSSAPGLRAPATCTTSGPAPLHRPAASAAPAPCPGEPDSDSRPCCSSAPSSEPRRLAAHAGCATLGLPGRLPGRHARCQLRPASAPTAPGLARRRPAPCLPRACPRTRADRVGPVPGQGPAPAGASAPPRTAPSRLPPHARAAPPPPAGVRAPLRLTAPCRLFPAVGRLPRVLPHHRCRARPPPRPQPAAVALGRPPLLATSGRGRVPRTRRRSPRPSPVPPAPAFGRASPAPGLPRPAPGRRLAHSRPAPPRRSSPRGCRLPSYADSAFAPCARPGPAPAPPAGSRPQRRPRLAASSLGRPARARPLAGLPLPAGVRLRSRPSLRAGSAYSPPRASGSSPQTPPRPSRHSTPALLVRPSYNGRTRKGQPPHVPVFARPRTSPCLRTGSTSRAVRLAAAVPYAPAPRFGPALSSAPGLRAPATCTTSGPAPLHRPAASAAPAPCPGEPASDSRPCCSSASSSEPRLLAARASCATLGLPGRLPGRHARCQLRPASAPTAPGLARRRRLHASRVLAPALAPTASALCPAKGPLPPAPALHRARLRAGSHTTRARRLLLLPASALPCT